MQAKNIVIAVLVLVLFGAIGYLFLMPNTEMSTDTPPVDTTDDTPIPVEPDGGIGDGAEPLDPIEAEDTRSDISVIGRSVDGSDITAYHFGAGETEILLIGGVHGGYSPNTSALAEELVEYFSDNESDIPDNILVTIIPTLNPDGMEETGAAGRFNANDVDLNRNFDCEWSAAGMWRDQQVSGGDAPFSEPETAALRGYIETYDPSAAVVWFSAEGKVYPSACADVPSNASVELAATFATAAGYPAEAEFDAYAITGDMVNWMAGEGIPAISVLLSDHQNTEFSKNSAGVFAVIDQYAE